MEITYEKIKHLITKEQVEGNQIHVTFKASNQETGYDTVAVVMPDQDQMMKGVAKSAVKSSVTSGGISWLGRIFGGLLGGAGGSIARSAANSAGSAVASAQMQKDMEKNMAAAVTEESKQQAIVTAFASFAPMYEWSDDQNCFLAKHV